MRTGPILFFRFFHTFTLSTMPTLLLVRALLGTTAAAHAAGATSSIEQATKPIEYSEDLIANTHTSNNIVGGDEITQGSRPYLVPVEGYYFCGGSLISPSAVLTAAHCMVSEWPGCKLFAFVVLAKNYIVILNYFAHN